MSGLDLLFAAFALLTAVAGLLAVAGGQVVRAALWLVVALGGLAGCYLLLGAEVVALVQLLVYVGAVVVLVLFALMLTRAPTGPPESYPRRPGWRRRRPASAPVLPGAEGDEVDQPRRQRLVAAAAGAAVTVLLAAVLLPALGGVRADVTGTRGEAGVLARALFGSWVLPFELLSVLLLAALVAALAVSRTGDVDGGTPAADSASARGGRGDHRGPDSPGTSPSDAPDARP